MKMKMLYLGRMLRFLSFLFVFITFSATAQYWAPTGATWHYTRHMGMAFPPFEMTYVMVESVGDTIINGKPCKILVKDTVADCSVPEDTSFTYMENDTVFWYNRVTNQFTILYDFNAVQNDTWITEIDSCPFTMTVDSTGSIVINGDTLKTLYISFFLYGSSQKIIERIGNVGYMFPDGANVWCAYNAPCDGPGFGPLRCYEDSILGFYNTGVESSCDTTYFVTWSVDELGNAADFTIYPNPTTGQFTVQGATGTIAVHDLLGKLVLTANKPQIDMSAFPKGVYIVRVGDAVSLPGFYWTGKLVLN